MNVLLAAPVLLASALTWVDPTAVKPGQRGVCVTEWSGGERIEIPVEVVGLLDSTGPDRRAVLVLESLKQRGLAPGRDISVAGFGDTASRSGACDSLTSCRIDFAKLGREAVRAALSPSVRGEGRFLTIPDRLVVRSSTGRPPGAGRRADP